MPLKRQPSEAELDALADEFRALWRTGDVIRPWLRKHQAKIKALVADDWSWATVADALTRAGITYRTKHPWTGDGLKSEVRRSSLPLRRQQGASPPVVRANPPAKAMPSPVASAPVSSHLAPSTSARNDTPLAAAGPSVSQRRFRTVGMEPAIPPHTPTPAEMEERERLRRKILGKKD